MWYTPLVTEQMLAEAAKMRKELNEKYYFSAMENDDPVLKEAKMEIMRLVGLLSEDPLDYLCPEMTVPLLALPYFVTLDLAATVDSDRADQLKEQGTVADWNNDIETLKSICDQFFAIMSLLTHPSLAPVTTAVLERLFLGITNFIVISSALGQNLEAKENWQHVEWTYVLDFNSVSPLNRFPYVINLLWLSSFVSYMESRLTPKEDEKTDPAEFPMEPVYAKDDEIGDTDTPLALLYGIHTKGQEDYELWLIASPDDDGTIHFYFNLLPEMEVSQAKKEIVEILMRLEEEIVENVGLLLSAWEQFSDGLEYQAIDQPDQVLCWMNKLITDDKLLRVSLDYAHLRKSLMTLHLHIDTSNDEEIEKICKIYMKAHSQHIPFRLRERLRQAQVEINEIIDVTRKEPSLKMVDKAVSHMRLHPERFNVITEDQVKFTFCHFGKREGKNRARDIRESLLERVAKAFKSKASKTTILRTVLKSF